MDNDSKLCRFMEALGPGVDVEVARSILEVSNWDLDAAMMQMSAMGMGGGGSASGTSPSEMPSEVRAPMATGYSDTLMAPLDPREEATLRREREARQAEQKRIEEERQATAEKRRREEVERQCTSSRMTAEQEAQERRRKQKSEQLALKRLQADPEAMKAHLEKQKAAEEEAARKQQVEEQRKQREAEMAEAEAARRREEADVAAKRRQKQEQEDLEREKAEAEARANANQVAAVEKPKEKPADEVVEALQLLRRTYKDSDPAGLVTCLQTLRKYLDNLYKNPSEPKFQRINSENANFKARVAAFDGSIAVLKACGFSEGEGGQLVTSRGGAALWTAITKIDVLIKEAESKAASLPKA